MTFKESPITLIAIGMLVIMKACIQPSDVTATEAMPEEATSTEVMSNTTLSADKEASLILELKNEKGEAVNQWLYGYNTANLFFHLKDEEQGVDLIKRIHPNILRFPGGTSANFYHFNKPGYGLKPSDAETVEGFNAYKNTKSSTEKEQEEINSGALTENHAQVMVDLCKETGASLLLVTNHFTGTDEENMAMVDFFSRSGVPIVGIELGNEYYLKTYADRFPDVASYIRAVKPLAKKLKAKHPEIPLAVVAAPDDEMKSMNSKRAEETAAWNMTLAREDFYEGYVVHNYSKNKNCDQMAILTQMADCYTEYNMELIRSTLPAGIEAYDQIYSPRKMWLTEWNVKEVFKGLGNTMLQAIYMAEHLMMLSDQDKVAMATYHNLLASGNGFNIISTNGKGKYAETAAYQTATLLSPLFNGETSHLALNTIRKGDNRLLTTKAFQNSTHRFIVVINQSPMPDIIGLNLESSETLKIEKQGFSADSPLSDASQLKTFNGPCTNPSAIEIPAYSVSLIQLAK